MKTHKIKSPKTNRWIDVYGVTYNKLLKDGYTNEQLLSSNISNTFITMLPDEILLEEIFMKSDTLEFINLCQSNKKYNELCKDENFWMKIYNKYFSDTGMSKLLPTLKYSKLVEICYNLHFLTKPGYDVKDLYLQKKIVLNSEKQFWSLKYIKYMYHLEKLVIKVENITNIPQISPEINNLIYLKQIIIDKI